MRPAYAFTGEAGMSNFNQSLQLYEKEIVPMLLNL
jgi:hypothetical protein